MFRLSKSDFRFKHKVRLQIHTWTYSVHRSWRRALRFLAFTACALNALCFPLQENSAAHVELVTATNASIVASSQDHFAQSCFSIAFSLFQNNTSWTDQLTTPLYNYKQPCNIIPYLKLTAQSDSTFPSRWLLPTHLAGCFLLGSYVRTSSSSYLATILPVPGVSNPPSKRWLIKPRLCNSLFSYNLGRAIRSGQRQLNRYGRFVRPTNSSRDLTWLVTSKRLSPTVNR